MQLLHHQVPLGVSGGLVLKPFKPLPYILEPFKPLHYIPKPFQPLQYIPEAPMAEP